MNQTRKSIDDYVYLRNEMDIQKLYQNYNNGNNTSCNRYDQSAITSNYPRTMGLSNFNDGDNYNHPNGPTNGMWSWMQDLHKYLPNYNRSGQGNTPTKPKIDLWKPLTKVDDVQFKSFTGLNPNKLSYSNLVDYKLINPMTRTPYPQFQDKIKPVYNGFNQLPTHYTVTPEFKRNITFREAEIQGFRGYNQF